MTHSILSPSSSKRWLTCTPSARIDLNFPDLEPETGSSRYAEEGTLAHGVAEALLKHPDILDNVKSYIDFVKEFQDNPDFTVKVEKRLDCTDWVPECYGTADALAWSKDECHVIDLKYGQGVRVSAKHNTQALIYALGCLTEIPKSVKTFTMHIIQPRIEDGNSHWTVTREELLHLGNSIRERAAQAFKGEGDYHPSTDSCRWCPAKNVCKANLTHEGVCEEL